MIWILADTCVWLDIAKDPREQPLLGVVEELVRMKEVGLIVPRIVLDEFHRNKARLVEECGRSLSGVFKRVKEAVDQFGDARKKRVILQHLTDIDHRIPQLGEAAAGTIAGIERLLTQATIIEPSQDVILRAAQRGIEKKAPFHRQRNGMDDAIILETYADFVRDHAGPNIRFAFVTHNVKDFSGATDNRKSHPDIAACFSKSKSFYFINLAQAVRRVRPALVSDLMIEHEWHFEPRSLSEIGAALDEFFDRVWYDRKLVMEENIRSGKETITPEILKGARRAMRKVEKKYGKDNLGPYTKFEWGMINGKLSALRWVLGDEWDDLDT